MAKRAEEQLHMFMPIPDQIEAEWNPKYAYLAGFPLNLLYLFIREVDDGEQLVSCCYWFDPRTYREEAERRVMHYSPTTRAPIGCASHAIETDPRGKP
jgi:hypothetical protein